MAEKSCVIQVNWYSSSGKPAKGRKVVGYVSTHALSTTGSEYAYTDENGRAVLRWSSHQDLKLIYIDGKEYKCNCEDGGIYSFAVS